MSEDSLLPQIQPQPEELAFIREAARELEEPRFFARAMAALGNPFEKGVKRLTPKTQEFLNEISRKALKRALLAAIKTMPQNKSLSLHSTQSCTEGLLANRKTHRLHSAAAVFSGVTGGAFGLAGLAVEIPITTTLLLRSIAATAQDFGADPRDPQIQIECLSLFSLGSPHTTSDDASESGYYGARAALSSSLAQAAGFLSTHSGAHLQAALKKNLPPALAPFVTKVASRYQTVLGQKLVSAAIPVAGALGAATLNALFMDHFNRLARYHFGLRQLERRYGRHQIEDLYQRSRRF